MPYIGNNHIAGDHTNNFKVLDDISSYTATFNGSATSVVDTTNNTIRVVEHRFIQGQRVTYTNGSGGNIGGLTTGTAYFIIHDSSSTFKLATSASNAATSTAINLSAVGTGSSHTLNAAFDGVNKKFKLTHGSGTGARLNNATQINVAINNVLQRPNLDPNNFTDGFALEDNHKIVFQTAPTSEDIFWGSIIANTLTTFDISDHKIDTFTGDGTTTEFNLSHVPANNESLMVSINGVLQHPSNASTTRSYTLIANVIQFTAAPANGDEIQVRHIGFAGATTSDVTGFYGRTGNVVLGSTDHITTGDITARNINASGILTASSASFGGNVSIGGTLTYEDVSNIDSVGIITARDGIRIPNNTGKLEFGSSQQFDLSTGFGSGEALINTTGVLNLATTSFRLRRASGSHYLMNADQGGRVYLYYDGSERFRTTDKGIQVGTGVTIETNGQAEVAGITTFYKDVHIKSGTNRLYLGTADRLSLIADPSHSYLRNAGSGSHFQIHSENFSVRSYQGNGSITLFYSPVSDGNEGGGPRLYHNHGAGLVIERLRTTKSGVNITGVTTTTGLAVTGVSTFTGAIDANGDLDVDGHTELDNLRVTGITTIRGDIRKPYGTYHPMLTIRNAAAGSAALRIDNWSNNTNEKRINISYNFNRLSSAFAADDSSIGCASIAFEDGEIRFGTSAAGTNNSQTRYLFNSSGHFIPNADSTYDIGTNSVRVRNVYADTLYGDGSNLTGITGTTINNNADNRVITGTGSANTLNAESNVHIDGSGRLLVGTSTNNAHANADNAVISGTGNIGLSIMSTDSGRSSIYFGDSSSSPGSYAGFIDFVHSSNSFNIGRGNDNSLTINSSGKVGINTVSPGRMVHIFSGSTGHPLILERGDNSNTQIEVRSGGAIRGLWGASSTANFMVYDNDASEIQFVVNQTGSVTIGDPATHTYSAHSEGDDLVIGGAGWRGMTIYGEGGGGVIQFADAAGNRDGQIMYDHGNRQFMFRTAGNVDRLLIDSDGNLHVKGTNHATRYYRDAGDRYGSIFYNGSNFVIRQPYGDNVQFEKFDGTVLGKFYTDGSLSVGHDTPQRRLHVKSGANNNNGAFRVESAPNNIMDMGTDSSMHFLNCVNNDPFRIKFAGNEALRITHETSGNGSTTLQFYMVTNNSQGATPYIKGVCGTEAGGADANNDGGLEFHTKTGGSGTDINAMRINANGRVAIGAHNIQNPTAALHIIGDTSGSNTALQVGQDSGQRYFRVNELNNQSNFGEVLLSFYDNTLASVLKLQNTYAGAANMGTAIQFIGHGGGQTGKISVKNRDANSASNSIMELSASFITKPNHPYFDVSKDNGAVSSTNVIVYNSVYTNNGSHYSSSNGRFTAPVDGFYQFWYGHIKNNTSDVVRSKFRKNGSGYLHGNRELRMDSGSQYGDNGSMTIITELNANDYIEIVVTAGTVYATANEYGYFCGTLLG